MNTITAQTIRDSIKSQLVGKDYTWGWTWDTYKAFAAHLKSQGISDKDFRFSAKRGDRQTTRIYYKDREIGYIDIKKEKGTTRYSRFGGSYCEWSIKDFNVMLYQDDLKKAMEVAEQRIIADNAAKNAKEQAALKLYKLILANCKDKYEAYVLIEYINSHRYTLEDKLEETE